MQRSLEASRAELSAYQRALWRQSPALWPLPEDEVASPMLSNVGLHLRPQASRPWFHAATAHAGAHLAYTRERFDAKSLKPITRALVGLLEDARVEWLACRELPGLRALWLSFHADDEGTDFEALMRRLARALLDPTHDDPHPWVCKGRTLFHGDAEGRCLGLRRAEDIRLAASRLGHDIGQMRLPFNPRLYRVEPGYRDDHACLWADEGAAQPLDAPVPDETSDVDASSRPAPEPPPTAYHYPEWDRLIGRHRLQWCTVLEQTVPPGPASSHEPRTTRPTVLPPTDESMTERLLRQLDGDALDLDAAVQAQLLRRAGLPFDERIHRAERRCAPPGAALWLVDLSASSSSEQRDQARQLALAAAMRLHGEGGVCAIDGFCSNGRHAVHYACFKGFDAPVDARLLARLAADRRDGSTRLGAAIRHATRRLLTRPEATRRLIVMTDGDAFDIDVHDPRYLVADARQAVVEARRRGLRVLGVGTSADQAPALRQVFGREYALLRA